VSVDGSVAPGVYDLTVDGSGTAGDRSTPLTLTVTAAPDYALSLNPAALSIVQGGNTPTTAVTITRTNFTGAVTLSLGGAPAGVTGAFAPAAPTGTSSTLTVTVGAAVAPGVYNLTVDGAGAPGNRSTPLTLTVTAAAADYQLSLAPAAFSVAPGGNAPTTVTITRTNFTGAVTLSLGNAPAGVTGAFNPAAPTGTSSTLTVTVGAAVAAGVYNLTVNGTGTPGNRSTPLTLTVTAAPDYALSLNPAALTIQQGTSTPTTAVTITRTNFTGAVTLSLGGAPAGVTGAFAPAAPTGTTSTLTVTVGAAVAPGVYNLTVDGAATGPGAKSTPLTLTVTAAPANYALSLNPAALTIVQGASTPTTAVTITRTNFTGAVTLSLGGVTGAFNPAAPTGTSSTLTVTVGAAVAPGVYNLTVDGTAAGPLNRSTPLTLTVTAAAADYQLSLNPSALSIAQGASTPTTAVTITRTNFTGAVTLSLSGAPAGVTGSFNPAAPTGTSSTLTVTVGASVTPGVYNLMVNGAATGPGARSTPLTLTVTSGGGGGSITWDYSACPVSQQPVWFAYQDGNGPWTVVTPVSNKYSFNIAGARGGITYVLSGTTSDVIVQYLSKAEFGTGSVQCPSVGVLKTVNGTVAGVGATEAAFVSLGGGTSFVYSFLVGFPNFQITAVQNGTYDLVASHTPSLSGVIADKAIIHRGLNIANGGSVGTLDFGSVDAFALDNATITISGLVGGEQVTQGVTYQAAACYGGPLYNGVSVTGSSYTAAGVPAADQNATDFHGFSVYVHDPATNLTRTTSQFYHALGDRTLTLAAVFPTPTVTSLGGGSPPYKRLQAVYTLPTDYEQSTGLTYTDQVTNNTVLIQATFAYLGSTSVTLALSDYSALAGWNNAWAPASANTADWSVAGGGGNATSGFCSEGARVDYAQVSGTN